MAPERARQRVRPAVQLHRALPRAHSVQHRGLPQLQGQRLPAAGDRLRSPPSPSTWTPRPTPTCAASSPRVSARRPTPCASRSSSTTSPTTIPSPAAAIPFSVTTAQMPAPLGRRSSPRADRPAGPPHRRPRAAAEQPRLPARRLGLDGIARQAAAGAARLPPPGRAASPAGPRRDRRLRRRRGARPAVHARRSDKRTILAALDELQAGGSTAGGEGIKLAYQVAQQNHIAKRQQPRHPRHRRRLQRRRVQRGRAGPPHRVEEAAGHVPHRARLRHRQPQGQPRWRRSPTRATATTPTSTTSWRRGRSSCRRWAPRW